MTLAKHLAICERKSAYPSEAEAKAATVTHSMLDVLGLMRRPEEKNVEEKRKKDENNVEVTEKENSIIEDRDSKQSEEEAMDVDETTISESKSVVENSIGNECSAVNDKPVTDDVGNESVQESES